MPRRLIRAGIGVVQQPPDIARRRVGDRVRRFEQNRVSHAGYFQKGHGKSGS